nr:unnamed protein product [Callosobruchus analis]
MSASDFEILLNKIGPKIVKIDTNLREAIPVKERLAITLRFLATGDSYTSLQYLFKISKQSISLIVPEVCSALIDALKDYVKMPTTPEEWLTVAQRFETVWDFPNCVGSMDGKHIALQAPVNSGSEYHNYKGFFSIVLFALVDADYNFLFVDIGCQGRISDGGVFQHSVLYHKIAYEELNKDAPYIFIADDAFPLTKHIMKPYSGVHPRGSIERIFNYRLSRARRVVENVFGIISSVFRVLRKPLLLEPNKAQVIVMAIVCLHNYLKKSKTSSNIYIPPGSVDSEEQGRRTLGHWRNLHNADCLENIRNVPRRATTNAKDIRKEIAEYFTSTGVVSWQNEYA